MNDNQVLKTVAFNLTVDEILSVKALVYDLSKLGMHGGLKSTKNKRNTRKAKRINEVGTIRNKCIVINTRLCNIESRCKTQSYPKETMSRRITPLCRVIKTLDSVTYRLLKGYTDKT